MDMKEAHIANAIHFLKCARDELRLAEAPKATDKVRKALKSAEGALRNAYVKRSVYHG